MKAWDALLAFSIPVGTSGSQPRPSNPFASGCLRSLLGPDAFPARRACNSDDPPDASSLGLCDDSPLDYAEVRISNQDWDGPMNSAWILQILLSELLGVPTTIETSSPDRHCNFYDAEGRGNSSAATYPYEALRVSKEAGDCREVAAGAEYKSCAHVLPMVNKIGQADNLRRLRDSGIISQARNVGSNEQYRWWMPKVHTMQHPELLSFFGLRENRPTLAKLLKRPTDWGTYCVSVSRNGCNAADEVATRAPEDEEEAKKYFAEGLYAGHFRATEKNNCTDNPDACTGHMANVPCSWGNYAVPQAYHLNISVESDGDLPHNGGYGYSSLLEIYAAANATGSNVLMYWWEPDTLIEKFRGTDYEFIPIYLPSPTTECEEHRVPEEGRCSDNFTEQVGSPIGSCDAGPVPNVMVTTLDACDTSDPRCSPAYAVLQNYYITNLNLQQIYKYRINNPEHGGRTAVCKWFAENLDNFKRDIPRTYPRQRRVEAFFQPLTYISTILAVICMVSVVGCAYLTKKYERSKVMKYAQVDFLLIILAGLFLVALAALLYSMPPTSKALCVSRNWFTAAGYSLEIIPLAVKVAAINRIVQGSKKMKKVTMRKRQLYHVVGGFVLAVLIFLATWTAVHPTVPQENMTLANENGNYVVEVSGFCASASDAWQLAFLVYNLVLLLVSTAIATQNRGIREEFNETRYLALMIYSSFMFTILRLAVFLVKDTITQAQAHAESAIVSILLSLDTLINIGIYFLPKIFAAKKEDFSGGDLALENAGSLNTSTSMRMSDPDSYNWRIRMESLRQFQLQSKRHVESTDDIVSGDDSGGFEEEKTEEGLTFAGDDVQGGRRSTFAWDKPILESIEEENEHEQDALMVTNQTITKSNQVDGGSETENENEEDDHLLQRYYAS